MMLALTTANFESSRRLTEARKSSRSILDPKESIRPFKSMAGASSMVKSGAYLETGNPNSNLDRFHMEEYECNICLADCSYKRYKSNKVFDCDFCPSCFLSGRFELGLAPLYLICIEYAEDYNDEKSSKVFDELENQGKEKLIDQFGILEIKIDDADLGRKIQEDVVVEDCDVVEGENQKDPEPRAFSSLNNPMSSSPNQKGPSELPRHPISASTVQMQMDAMFPPVDNSGQKSRGIECKNTVNAEKESSMSSFQAINKQQQHSLRPQTSVFPIYGGNSANLLSHPYARPPITAAASSLRSQTSHAQDMDSSQMGSSHSGNVMNTPKFEMQNIANEAMRIHGGPGLSTTSHLTPQQLPVSWQSMANKEHKSSIPSMPYVKQEVVDLIGEPPHGALGGAIDTDFGSLDALMPKAKAEGAALQGAGWVWLALDKEMKKIKIETTANQDPLVTKGENLVPLLDKIVLDGWPPPICKIDVEDEEDSVVHEIDVFYTPHEVDDAQLYLRSYWHPRELKERYKEVKVKPKSLEAEVILSVDLESGNLNQDMLEVTMFHEQMLTSKRAFSEGGYTVGFLINNQLHLNPVSEVLQFWPSMVHLNGPGMQEGKNKCQEVDSKSEYLDSLCPRTPTLNRVAKVPSTSFFPLLPLEERLKKWPSQGCQVSRYNALKYLDVDATEEDFLNMLQHLVVLTQGLWVSKSSLIFEDYNASLGDYILYLFSTNQVLKLDKLKNPDLLKQSEEKLVELLDDAEKKLNETPYIAGEGFTLAATSKGLSSIITLDSETLQQLGMFRVMLCAFPPKSVQLSRPFSDLPWTKLEDNIGNFFLWFGGF